MTEDGKIKFCINRKGFIHPVYGHKENATSITVVNNVW